MGLHAPVIPAPADFDVVRAIAHSMVLADPSNAVPALTGLKQVGGVPPDSSDPPRRVRKRQILPDDDGDQ